MNHEQQHNFNDIRQIVAMLLEETEKLQEMVLDAPRNSNENLLKLELIGQWQNIAELQKKLFETI